MIYMEIDHKEPMKPAKALISATIDVNILNLAKQNNISRSYALEFGLKFLLADSDLIEEYPKCNLLNKLHKFQNILNENRKEGSEKIRSN